MVHVPVVGKVERERQESLGRYAILDTPPELAYDCITALVARMLDVPAAVVTFIDRDRQWFKSRVGFDLGETHRDVSFCAHTILGDDVMVVSDTLLDERFADNPLVTGPPNLRFYAGAPLITPEGVAVGALGVASTRPRLLTDAEAVLLRQLAAVIVTELEQRVDSGPHGSSFAENIHRSAALESLPAVTWTTDTSLRFTSSGGATGVRNISQGHLQGVTLEEYLGNRPASAAVMAAHRRALGGEVVHYQMSDLGQDWVSSVAPLTGPGGQVLGTIGVAMDVTERNRAATHLFQRDHLESIGTLAAGIAHEINNPLSYILANASVAAEELTALAEVVPPGVHQRLSELRILLDEVAQGAGRAAGVIRDLKLFAGGHDEETVASDPRLAVRAALRMTQTELHRAARVREELGEVPLVRGSPGRLASLLVNILVNAAQAIGVGRIDEKEIVVRTRLAAEGWVAIEVIDSGPGIPADVVARVFDPFFTTKPFGAGRGLGLSICHGIVTALGGRIEFDRVAEGTGTLVRVLLPPAGPPAEVAGSAARVRVLVVDDEDAVCRSLRRVLGPKVDTEIRHSAHEAMELLAHDRRFDVILCDVVMPDGDGPELYQYLCREALELAPRLVFVTGGGLPRRLAEGQPSPPVMEKPFDVEQMREMVARIARRPSVR